MSNRKETPDLLGDILSPQPAAPVQNESVQSKPATTPSSNPAPKTTPKTAQRKTTSSRSTKPVTPQSAMPQPAMPQWEYMEVIFREFRGWHPRFVNGEELEDWREQPEIRDYLAVVGAEGWEMVGIMENKRNTRSIYFKRPLR